ncbi:MAG: hypothetical protein KC656_36055, partial [Myxococcales bacterium]|nr:hypothetical protein [Myxococcales bacterium]
PHVAGAAAVLLSRGVPAARVRDTLLESARGSGTWDEKYGHGQLDLAAALGQTTRSSSSPVPFLLGGIFAFLLAQMAGTSAAFRAKSTLAGALAGGGLFFLGALGLPDLMVVRLLSTGLVHWPEILFGGGWMHFPLWLSAALPMGLAFTLGAYHKTRPVALGVAAAFAATLFHGAATGALAPWWMPVMLGQAWLAMNATFSVLLGMGMAGTEILEQMERRR